MKVNEPSLRERKKQATRAAIVATARELTLEHGFNGFTLEQLCERVGVSRRTLFNYFGSKEDAVLGWDGLDFPEDLQAEFIAPGKNTSATQGALTPTLLEDLLQMIISTTNRSPETLEQHRQLHQVILSEPQFLLKARESFEKRERQILELVAKRENANADDPRIQMAVTLVGAIMHKATEESFRANPANGDEEATQIMHRYLHAAKNLIENSQLENKGSL
nr:TetR/AcrR family transcriptional regulator [Psychromicrobium silvestre]